MPNIRSQGFAAVLDRDGILWIFGEGETHAEALADAQNYDRVIAASVGLSDADLSALRVIPNDDDLRDRRFRGTAGIMFVVSADA